MRERGTQSPVRCANGAREEGLEQWTTVVRNEERRAARRGSQGRLRCDVKSEPRPVVAIARPVAAATSTVGSAKKWGRSGSPLIGAGTYADDRAAAVSATGSGEYFIRAVAGHQLAERIRLAGESLQAALDGVLQDIKELGGKGGMIAVSPSRAIAWGFTTRAMYRGSADAERSGVAIETMIDWPHGRRSVYFRDPAGNSLEFATPRMWRLS